MMNGRLILAVAFVSTIVALPFPGINVDSDEDCQANANPLMMDKYAALVKFSPRSNYSKGTCSVHIGSAWAPDMQNGFGIFIPLFMDCSSTMNIECLPGAALNNRTNPSAVQYTCQTSSNVFEMPCSSIRLTYNGSQKTFRSARSTQVQVVALSKAPCLDENIFFQCPRDYPNSCIHQKLQCNGAKECPSGDDERACQESSSAGMPIIIIILAVLAFLFFTCVLSTVLMCCCCRATCNAILHRCPLIHKGSMIEKGEAAVVRGEDAGLMKGLAAPSFVDALPQQHLEPTALMIDSTKPVYPRLE